MREDEVQVPESELLDDSALEGITGGLGVVTRAVMDPTGVGRNLPNVPPTPPPPLPFQDG